MENTSLKDGITKTVNAIKKFLKSKLGKFVVPVAMAGLALLFTIIFYSIHFTEYEYRDVNRGDMSFWSTGILPIESNKYYFISPFGAIFIAAFIIDIAFFAGAVIFMLLGKERALFYVATVYNIVLNLASLIVGIAFKFLQGSAIGCSITAILISMLEMAYLILSRSYKRESEETQESASSSSLSETSEYMPVPAKNKISSRILLITVCTALFILCLVFFVPVYSITNPTTAYSLINALSTYEYPVILSISFIVVFIAFFAELIFFASAVSCYVKADKLFADKGKKFVTSTTVFTLLFFILGYSLTFYFNLKNKSTLELQHAVTISYVPFILSIAALIVCSVCYGKLKDENGIITGNYIRKPFKLEPLIAFTAITAVTFLTLALNVIEIKIKVGPYQLQTEQEIKLNGYQLLTTYKELASGFQALAFIEFAFLLTSGILLALSVVSYFSKDKGYYSLIKVGSLVNFLFVLVLGLFGFYFKIAQKVNLENIQSILDHYQITLSDSYKYDVSSRTIFLLFASFAIIVYMLCRKIFNMGADTNTVDESVQAAKNSESPVILKAAENIASVEDNGTSVDFDACAAFTELDGKQEQFRASLNEKRLYPFFAPTLPALVRFVVDYARESRLHLSYSIEDIATFVAGLGASRLAILQGMSGTGKTSLPKIFTEALMGNCEIIEVESSWRDKNELLGYYNEFSKCFTPKKFTQCLYKARLNPSIVTFIVLDEMNLSRIEYYFSDFLSLMENEEDKREIKLLNVKLYRTENGQKIPYDGLTDGHTIKIPSNVWFIGTANRDESTFEISDKVYDRAQTMNFNKRAPKIHSYGTPLAQRFITYDEFIKLLEEAKQSYVFEAENNELVRKTEKLLARYNISFGNRILKQMEDFVKIYCACFSDKSAVENDAVERILLSKVVSKLENKIVENKESLALEFDNLGLKKCSEFIRKLNED